MIDQLAPYLESLTPTAVMIAALGFFLRSLGYLIERAAKALAEKATAERLEKQAELERAAAAREDAENTGKHLLFQSEAASAYRLHVEKEIAELRAELAQAYVDLDITRGQLAALRDEFDSYRKQVAGSHSPWRKT